MCVCALARERVHVCVRVRASVRVWLNLKKWTLFYEAENFTITQEYDME